MSEWTCFDCLKGIQGEPIACPHCAAQTLLDGRFRMRRVIAQGPVSVTFDAVDTRSGSPVIARAVRMNDIGDWRAQELFNRRSRQLGHLRHEGLPETLATFSQHTTRGALGFTVEEKIVGEPLSDYLRSGGRLDADATSTLLSQILDTLDRLHGESPPLVHGAVHPENVLHRAGRTAALLGTSHMRGLPNSTSMGIFQAPEARAGSELSPRADVYSAGAVAAAALVGISHTSGDALRDAIRTSHVAGTALGDVLVRMLSPSPAERFGDARVALSELGATSSRRAGEFGVGSRGIFDAGSSVQRAAASASESPSRLRSAMRLGTTEAQVRAWLVGEVRQQIGSAAAADPNVQKRIAELAPVLTQTLNEHSSATVNLPFLYADASGPKHFEATLLPHMLTNAPSSSAPSAPSAPTISAVSASGSAYVPVSAGAQPQKTALPLLLGISMMICIMSAGLAFFLVADSSQPAKEHVVVPIEAHPTSVSPRIGPPGGVSDDGRVVHERLIQNLEFLTQDEIMRITDLYGASESGSTAAGIELLNDPAIQRILLESGVDVPDIEALEQLINLTDLHDAAAAGTAAAPKPPPVAP